MNFDFSDDQKLLKDQARKFLKERCPPKMVRNVLDHELTHDKALWAGIAEMGWLGTAIPEAYGGLGLGYLELCVLAEEMGRALAPVPFSSTIFLAGEALLQGGSEAQRKTWLPRFASGEAIGTLALSEGPYPATAKSIRTAFKGGKLEGTKIPVPDGMSAGMAIVAARTADTASARDIVLAIVDMNGPGVSRHAVKTLDPSRAQAEIHFSGAPAEVLGQGQDGWSVLQRVLDRAAILTAFEQVGGADVCLEQAIDYAKNRYAFGRSIASFQAIKHKLADMYVFNELARSNAYYGGWALSTDAPDIGVAAASARVAATQAFHYASKENIQTHGGMGFTWEFDCHLYYRRAKHLALSLGSERAWKDKLVAQLEARNAA